MDYFHLYFSFLKKFYSPNPDKKLKVVFDCSNGTAGLILEKFTTNHSKLKIYFINDKPDGYFPAHGPNPLKPGAVKQLQAAVEKNKADLGIIFDADADRVFFVDDKSRFIDPDAVARLLIWHLKPKKVIIDVSAGWLVKKLKIIESKVGHYFIKQKMRKENADFGAEHSGHYYFKEFFGLDSGILAAIEVINAVSRLPYKLSDFVELLPKYYRQEINIRRQTSNFKCQELLKKIEDYYKLKALPGRQAGERYKLLRISRLDGLTMEFSDWWLNLRFSNTEPLLRLNVEAQSKFKLQEQIFKLKKLLRVD